MIKKILSLSLALTIPAIVSAKSAAQPKHLGNKIELIFLQHAETGKIIANPKNPKCYQLALNQLNEHVIYISDAPMRVTGSYSISQFAEIWRHNEKIDHVKPNAILHAKQNNHWVNDTAVFSNLQYNSKKGVLTYTLCPLDKKNVIALGKLEAISLFIDPFHPWPP